MENFQLFDAGSEQQYKTRLFLNVDEAAEQTFLSQVGGASARKRDVAAMADQYSGTHIETLCFAGSNLNALDIWAQRCRELDMTSLLTLSAKDPSLQQKAADFPTDGIILDCCNCEDLTVINDVSDVMQDGLFYIKVNTDAKSITAQNISLDTVHGVVICSRNNTLETNLSVADWISIREDFEVVAGVSSVLCEANGKKWFATPEIMNGQAVNYLSQHCAGLFLDGFCADLFDPDSMLFDIYETCGDLNECIGAKRRHLHLVNTLRAVLPGADYHCTLSLAPVFDGAPVCVVLAADEAADENAISVFCGEKELEYTGEPVVIVRNEKGRLCENQCLSMKTKCFEFYAGNRFENEELTLRIHNNTKKNVVLRWLEASVNI